ncbi:hypothetical protein [Nocardioides sp. MH1]|uniref:hypothetical protein n=1 Tax=Nocardioides sp. MH1 TaxID=3242490 RepID=UPI00352043B0
MRRAAAVLTGALATLVTFELAGAGHVEGYGIALVGTVVAAAVTAAVRLWRAAVCTPEVWMATGLIAGVVVTGQLLASWLGGPGMAAPQWTATGFAVMAVGVAVLLLVGCVALAPRKDDRRHPYAL